MKFCFRYFILLGTIILIFADFSASQSSADRPSYFGAFPAYPLAKSLPEFTETPPFLLGEKTYKLILEIDTKGKVTHCRSDSTNDTLLVKYVFSSLRNLKFKPAALNDKIVKSELPIRVSINPRFRTTEVTFPIDSALSIEDRTLFFDAVKNLNLTPPRIIKFPSYFCDKSTKDSLQILPYLLLKVNVDSSGRGSVQNEIGNTIGEFGAQVQSAILWTEFEPLKVSGKPLSSECYLLVSFFPQLEYPTKTISFSNDSTLLWHDRWRLQLIPDTIGIMLPPMPKMRDLSLSGLVGKERFIVSEVKAEISVDTSGNVKLNRTDSRDPEMHKLISRITQNSDLFPAMDFSGRPVQYIGKVTFVFQSSKNVRTDYSWLNN